MIMIYQVTRRGGCLVEINDEIRINMSNVYFWGCARIYVLFFMHELIGFPPDYDTDVCFSLEFTFSLSKR